MDKKSNNPPKLCPPKRGAVTRIRNMSVKFRLLSEEILVLAGVSRDWEDEKIPVIFWKSSNKRGFSFFPFACLVFCFAFSVY